MSLPPVVLTLVANGIEGVTAAFRSIEKSAKRMESNLVRINKSGASARTSFKEKEYQKLVRDADRYATEELNIEKKKNSALEAEAKKSAVARERHFNKMGSGMVSGFRSTIGKMTGLAATALAIGGGFSIVDSLQGAIKQNAMAQQISLSAKIGGSDVSKKEVLGTSKAVALKHGFTTDESLEAFSTMMEKTGNIEIVKSSLEDLASLANASNVGFKDLAHAAGLVWNSDKTMSAEKLMRIMAGIAEQGAKGALDIKDLGDYMARLSGASAEFGGDLEKNMKFIGALAQSSIGVGAASAAEATEGVKSLFSDSARHKNKLEGLGIQTRDAGGIMLDPETIIKHAIVKTKGDPTKLMEIFGERSMKAVGGLAIPYSKAYGTAKQSGKSDLEASKIAFDAMNKVIEEATTITLNKGKIEELEKIRMQETDKKLTIAMEQLKTAVANSLLPAFESMIPIIINMAQEFNNILKSMGLDARFFGDGLKTLLEDLGLIKKPVAPNLGTNLKIQSNNIGKMEKYGYVTNEDHANLLKSYKDDMDKAKKIEENNLGGALGSIFGMQDADAAKVELIRSGANEKLARYASESVNVGKNNKISSIKDDPMAPKYEGSSIETPFSIKETADKIGLLTSTLSETSKLIGKALNNINITPPSISGSPPSSDKQN